MQLVIAEKPSVAMSIAAVIGADERKDGYMEGGGFIVSWCMGHLAGLADATHYGDFKKWRYEVRDWQTLPITGISKSGVMRTYPYCRSIGKPSYPRIKKNSLKP